MPQEGTCHTFPFPMIPINPIQTGPTNHHTKQPINHNKSRREKKKKS